MQAIAGKHCLAVAQVGPDFMIVESPIELPPMPAELIVEIDGHAKRRSIYLPDGIRKTASRTRISPA
jgi:hypothetical protein